MERPDHEDMAKGDEAPPESEATGGQMCPDCHGSGRQDGETCPTCGGEGRIEEAVGGG